MARHRHRHRHNSRCNHDDYDDDYDEDDEDDDEDSGTIAGLGAENGPSVIPIRNETKKIGRNEPCPCGSGKKYKKCHINQPGT